MKVKTSLWLWLRPGKVSAVISIEMPHPPPRTHRVTNSSDWKNEWLSLKAGLFFNYKYNTKVSRNNRDLGTHIIDLVSAPLII